MPPSDGLGGDRASVLIVDDEPLVALYIADVVEDAGECDVATASSADEAIAAAAIQPPDVAIVDVSLGEGANGTSVAAQLVSSYRTTIIFLSGHSNVQDDPAVRDLKPAAILSKPCLPADLENALQTALRDKR